MAHSTKLIFCALLVAWATCVITAEIRYTEAGVAITGGELRNKYSRAKRAITREIVSFNAEEQKAVLDRHNYGRSLRNASNMMMMEWNAEIERSAQSWAQQCKFKHSPKSPNREKKAGYGYLGENIFISSGRFDPAGFVQLWYDEVKYYDYNTQGCVKGQMCGHYTQVVWADSEALGCGVKYCEKLDDVGDPNFTSGYIVVCQYGPGGNYIGQKPYKLGDVCSLCPKEKQFCVKNLCVKSPVEIEDKVLEVEEADKGFEVEKADKEL